jgi:hypothetical protein
MINLSLVVLFVQFNKQKPRNLSDQMVNYGVNLVNMLPLLLVDKMVNK